MKFKKLKSFAKINLSLNVIKKLPNKYHSIESLVSFVEIFDEIKIKTINKKNHKIIFFGKFAKGIKKNNTISKLFYWLEKKNLIGKKKFEIRVKKNIPQKSGMGGGSMNAAVIFKYLIREKIVNISNLNQRKISDKIGSDVALGLEKKNSILFKNRKIGRTKHRVNLYVLIVMPKFGCSTEEVFSKVNKFSKSIYFKNDKKLFNLKNLKISSNNLENIVFKKYGFIKNLNLFLKSLPGVIFTRMTGTGSALVAYFKYKNRAKKAGKIFKSKYKSYWYIVSKTI